MKKGGRRPQAIQLIYIVSSSIHYRYTHNWTQKRENSEAEQLTM